MSGKLQHEIKKQKAFDSLEQEAALNLHKTHDAIASLGTEVLKRRGLSSTQYNVLRILRGAGDALACGEIASRMITREPDMTRLLDRMEKRGLVSRCRQETDRRVVKVKITGKGLDVLAELDEPVLKMHRRQLGHLGPAKLRQLIALLEEAREAER